MPKLLSANQRVLRDYFFASSVEETLAYLSAHRGEAQIVGGGTTLMPQVQRGQSHATRLVDVSRIPLMRRVKLEQEYLILGGAVTAKQLLNQEMVAQHLPVLTDMAQTTSNTRLRRLSTLAGSIVSAQGASQAAVVLTALNAEAEISNLTGSQWLPVRSLFVRPGVSRVNSMTEVITALRLPLLGPGQGAATVRIASDNGDTYPAFVLAIALGLGRDRTSVDWLTVVFGTPGTVPRDWDRDELVNGHVASDNHVRQSVIESVVACAQNLKDDDLLGRIGDIIMATESVFDRALERAHSRLTERNDLIS